jgi:hypothetical protein
MKKTLILFALAGLTAAAACGDDGDDKGAEPSGKPDAGSTGKPDAAVPVSRGVQVTNLGASCETKSSCTGTGAVECISDLEMLGGKLEGGYCTAECKLDDECGPKGACPIANLGRNPLVAQLAGLLGGSLDSVIDSQCFLTCVKTEASPCPRADMTCSSIADVMGSMGGGGGGPDLSGILNSFPEAKQTFCFPPFEQNDAGVRRPDAGAALIVTGLDAGL